MNEREDKERRKRQSFIPRCFSHILSDCQADRKRQTAHNPSAFMDVLQTTVQFIIELKMVDNLVCSPSSVNSIKSLS